MCGFLGVFSRGGRRPTFPGLEKTGRVLTHRGPDAVGLYEDGPATFAAWRLNVLDLSSAGNQPMLTPDGRYCLLYNGEVYNFRDLKERFRLEASAPFQSATDTEVVLRLFEKKGPASFSDLNGMFALAVWDRERRELFLARDPFGIKPIFYHEDGKNFWFASEIKAILAAAPLEPEPDPRALHRYLQFDYIPGELTAFRGIRELRPGHWLKVDEGGNPEIRSYWEWPSRREEAVKKTEAVAASLELLRRAVRRQLISDVPIGVMLSGGLDSSALTALMAEARGDSDFHTFSLAFRRPSFDESKYARMVARKFGTTHHVIDVEPGSVWSALRKQAAYIDEPYADGSAIPTFLLARAARDHVTVLLAGEGGDELFAGYDTHLAFKYREGYLKVPRPARKLLGAAIRKLPVSHRKLSLEFKLKRFLQAAENDPAASHFSWRAVASPELVAELTGSRPDPADLGVELFRRTCAALPPQDPIARLTFLDCLYHLPDDLMIKCDRMTMAFSLEARVPYTDLELVRFVMSLPDSVRFPGRKQKFLLRRAMRGILPPEVINKKKVGLEIPYSSWFCREWKDQAGEVFNDRRAACGGLLDPAVIRRVWEEHLRRKKDNGRLLWGLLNYITWYDLYIRSPGSFRSQLNPVREPR